MGNERTHDYEPILHTTVPPIALYSAWISLSAADQGRTAQYTRVSEYLVLATPSYRAPRPYPTSVFESPRLVVSRLSPGQGRAQAMLHVYVFLMACRHAFRVKGRERHS
jgi:hypothetical protein